MKLFKLYSVTIVMLLVITALVDSLNVRVFLGIGSIMLFCLCLRLLEKNI